MQYRQVRGAAPSMGWRTPWQQICSNAPQTCQSCWPKHKHRQFQQTLSIFCRCHRLGWVAHFTISKYRCEGRGAFYRSSVRMGLYIACHYSLTCFMHYDMLLYVLIGGTSLKIIMMIVGSELYMKG